MVVVVREGLLALVELGQASRRSSSRRAGRQERESSGYGSRRGRSAVPAPPIGDSRSSGVGVLASPDADDRPRAGRRGRRRTTIASARSVPRPSASRHHDGQHDRAVERLPRASSTSRCRPAAPARAGTGRTRSPGRTRSTSARRRSPATPRARRGRRRARTPQPAPSPARSGSGRSPSCRLPSCKPGCRARRRAPSSRQTRHRREPRYGA